ncbi:MAG: acyl-CoA dehydrogenase [Gammaproteobacteria bacterium]
MTLSLALALIAVGSGALLFLRAPLWSFSVYVMLTLVAYSHGSPLPAFALGMVWVPLAVVLHVKPLRRRLISARILERFRAVLPTMSATEREALEAGTVGWDGELFSGRPNWQTLLAYPRPQLSAAEQRFIDGPTEQLCALVDDWQITERLHDLPEPVWDFLKHNGFFGLIIPRRYGGLDFSALAHSAIVLKIASRSISAAVTAMVPNSLGPAKLLLHYGTEAQKDYYLPRLARGEEVPCFALTSPEAGSDAAAMTDFGVVCKGEFGGASDVLGIRLNWDKRYITLGPVATVLGLAFKLFDPDHLLGDKADLGITLALIPTDTPGVQIGNRHFPLSQAFQNGPNSGRDVFIPLDWIIGGVARAGQGWRMLMECLAEGRAISLPALSVGAGKLACRATGAYARVRTQFHQPIGRFEGVEEALARIAGFTYQMDAARLLTTTALDQGEKPAVISAIVKYHLTERMRRIVNDAMDIHGGSGICLGPRNILGRVYQAVPISITVEGANILTRSLIIFGQGAMRCHPFVLREMQAVGDTDKTRGLRDFDRALFGHIGFTLSNALRSLVLGCTGARLAAAPLQGAARRYLQQASRMSAAFALLADFAMLLLGGSLKRRERLSARFADVLSNLYLLSATVKRFHEAGEPATDPALLHWACHDALFTMQQGLDDILRNFPNRLIAALLRVLIFPLGRRYRKPSDTLDHALAGLLLEPSAARDRLSDGIYLPSGADDALARLETALQKIIAAEPVEQKLRRARLHSEALPPDADNMLDQAIEAGIITAEDAAQWRSAAAARKDALQVDDFPPDYWCQEPQAWRNSPVTQPAKRFM